jgi:hypothetical protein
MTKHVIGVAMLLSTAPLFAEEVNSEAALKHKRATQ